MVSRAGRRLEETVTARWRQRLAGSRPEERRHWRTRTAYYMAVNRLLSGGTCRPSWSQVTDAVEPRGSRSTFYEVIGAHAKHSLIGELMATEAVDAMQLAMCYQRASAVEQLIDETKVWAYWPHREYLSSRYRIDPDLDEQTATDLLLATVADWARRNEILARALSFAPPVCAVEDLLAICPGRFSAVNAASTLTRVMADAVGA